MRRRFTKVLDLPDNVDDPSTPLRAYYPPARYPLLLLVLLVRLVLPLPAERARGVVQRTQMQRGINSGEGGMTRGKNVQRPGAVTIVKVNDRLPKLQLDPLSNRKSADLLSTLSAEFSLVQASAAESTTTKEAIAAYYAGVLNPSKLVEQPATTITPTTTAATDFDAPASSSQPFLATSGPTSS